MGKPYSKIEDKEVIIAQNASGGKNSASDQEQENHIKYNNILITTFLILAFIVVLTFVFIKLKNRHKKWIEKRVNSEFLRMMRNRLSMKRDRTGCQGRDEEDI